MEILKTFLAGSALFLAFLSTVFWSGMVSTRVSALEDWRSQASPILQQALQDETNITEIKDSVKDIQAKTDWIYRYLIEKDN